MIEQVESAQSYQTIAQLASETGRKHDAIYAFIKKFNREHPGAPILALRFPTTGAVLHLKQADAEMIKAVLLHPEQYAETVKL